MVALLHSDRSMATMLRTRRSRLAAPRPLRCRPMRIYAERPGRAGLQLLADIGVVVWVLLVVHLARAAQAALLGLQAPAQRLTGAGDSIRGAFDGAARTASGVPFVGDELARALSAGTGAGDSLSASGRDLSASVASAGMAVGAAVVVVGVVPVVLVWFALRVRWVRAARSAVVARAAAPDLLALHALTRRPTADLLRATGGTRSRDSSGPSGPATGHDLVPPSDPATAWRLGDPDVVSALAAVELAALGLRNPRVRHLGRADRVPHDPLNR
jgi:hypothetical protein